jgi:phosphoglycolate phosphatase-like HAD superfamily hydrolase
VLFDMDGTLTDSEPVWDEALRRAGALARWIAVRRGAPGDDRHQRPVSVDIVHRDVGRPDADRSPAGRS